MLLIPIGYTWFFLRVIIILILKAGNINCISYLLLSIHMVFNYALKIF